LWEKKIFTLKKIYGSPNQYQANSRVSDIASIENNTYTVKPAHAVTSIKQPPVLKGHLFLLLS
jgi:hypothetical protein